VFLSTNSAPEGELKSRKFTKGSLFNQVRRTETMFSSETEHFDSSSSEVIDDHKSLLAKIKEHRV
jgi:hypothetical protein